MGAPFVVQVAGEWIGPLYVEEAIWVPSFNAYNLLYLKEFFLQRRPRPMK
jgi:hypothetical protein